MSGLGEYLSAVAVEIAGIYIEQVNSAGYLGDVSIQHRAVRPEIGS